mgnify:CR=1 FL=1
MHITVTPNAVEVSLYWMGNEYKAHTNLFMPITPGQYILPAPLTKYWHWFNTDDPQTLLNRYLNYLVETKIFDVVRVLEY